MQLKKYPLFLVLFPFMAGIFTALQFNIEFNIPLFVLCVILLGLVSIFYFLATKKPTPTNNSGFSIVLIVSFFVIGIFHVSICWDYLQNNHFSKLQTDYFVVEISSTPIEKANNIQADIRVVKAIDFEGEQQSACGNSKAYFAKDSLRQPLKYGMQLLVANKFKTIESVANPYEFDYKTFLKHKNTFYQASFKDYEIKILPTKTFSIGTWFMGKMYALRAFLLQKIVEFIPNSDNAAVAAALLLGDKQLLHKDLQAVYQDTGAMHILAVSGLHVGIICSILLWAFSIFNGLKQSQLFKSIGIIVALWVFACLTGLAPSVARATLMFSFVIMGQLMARPINIFNSLAASAFILLLINPFLLMELGFQLSYLAVISIVIFYPKIKEMYTPKNYFALKLWDLNCVATSAQLLTLPITLYYFHQFPLNFVLSNPIAIFGATLVLFCGISFFAALFISFIFPFLPIVDWVAAVLNIVLSLLNNGLSFIQSIPFGTLKNLFISPFQFVVLSLMLLFIAFAISNKKMWLPAQFMALFLGLSLIFTQFRQSKQLELSVYQVPKKSVVALRAGAQAQLLHNFETPEMLTSKLNNSFIAQGISKKNYQSFDDSFNEDYWVKMEDYILFGNKSIFTIHPKNHYHLHHWTTPVDYLVVKDNPFLKIESLSSIFEPKKIIFDGSNSQKNCNYWRAECEELNLPCHFTATDGAFTVILN